ncbi:MAG: hypothetical protein EKK55_01840 [Rhodocyclaceae bacterium]|nr:MAG: hypothetical protein EKK55_01840 [Rhodocyclaceae bacterium]
MACHYPDLTPEQLAMPVEPGLWFARCERGITYHARVERVVATGYCEMSARTDTGRHLAWLTKTSDLRRHYHPSAAP